MQSFIKIATKVEVLKYKLQPFFILKRFLQNVKKNIVEKLKFVFRKKKIKPFLKSILKNEKKKGSFEKIKI